MPSNKDVGNYRERDTEMRRMENLQILRIELDDIRVYGTTGSERSETVQTRK